MLWVLLEVPQKARSLIPMSTQTLYFLSKRQEQMHQKC